MRLEVIEAFLVEADAAAAFDDLLDQSRSTVIPNLVRFPRIGQRYLDHPPQSAEAISLLAAMPTGAADSPREHLHGDYLMLYTVADELATVYPPTVRLSDHFGLPGCGRRTSSRRPRSMRIANGICRARMVLSIRLLTFCIRVSDGLMESGSR